MCAVDGAICWHLADKPLCVHFEIKAQVWTFLQYICTDSQYVCQLSLVSYQLFNRVYQLLSAVVLHHLISSITVSTTGSALMMLVRDLLEAAPEYVATQFPKWHPGGTERREQPYRGG